MIVKNLEMTVSHCKARLQTAFAVILLLHFLVQKTFAHLQRNSDD